MKWVKIVAAFSFFFPVGILNAAPGDSIWILNVDTTNRPYFTYAVCDTERNPFVGDTECLPQNESHCDTGALLGSADTQYINFDYTMQNGYAGFKIDWDGGTSRFDATNFDTLVIYHKGPLTGETVTINFGASATCGMPTVFTTLGTFSGSSSWKREAFPVLPLVNDSETQGLYEMQVLINDATKPTASGNFKLDNMVFIKNIIKDQASRPALLSPVDSALAQPLRVNLTWAKVPIATSYAVEVSTNVDFVSQIFEGGSIVSFSNTIFSQSGLSAPSVTVSVPLGGQPYFWHALAANAMGASPWSVEWSFVTTTDPIGNISSIPTLTSPTNNATGEPMTVNLAWSSVSVATSYGVQVSTDVNFGTTVFSQKGLASPSATVSGLATGTTYYWRADAADQNGTSGWSNVGFFSTAGSTTESTKKNCGCGSGTGVALIPPLWFKAMAMRRKKRQKKQSLES